MSEKKKNPEDQLAGPAKSSGQEPEYVKPASQKIAEEQFIEQFQRLLDSADPIQFDDSWEGCVEGPAS